MTGDNPVAIMRVKRTTDSNQAVFPSPKYSNALNFNRPIPDITVRENTPFADKKQYKL